MSAQQISGMTDTALGTSGDYVPFVRGSETTNRKTDLAAALMAVKNNVATRTALAALTSSAGAVQLTESGREGMFAWSASNLATLVTADTAQGIYVPPAAPADTTGANGAWVRQFGGVLLPGWFGMVADDDNASTGTNNAAPFAAMVAVVNARAKAGSVNPLFYRGGDEILIVGRFYVGAFTYEPLATCQLRGIGGLGWGAPSRIRVAGATAVRAQAHNTSGASTFDAVTHFAGDSLLVEDIYFLGGFVATEGEFHGCHAKRPIRLNRCTFDNFAGDGFYSWSTFGSGVGSTEGNTNSSRITDCLFTNCRSGVFARGADANAWTLTGCSFIDNRRCGVEDRGFLGNHYYGHHFDGNARTAWNTGAAGHPVSYTGRGGNWYFVIEGQEVGAVTNAPKSSTVTITIASPGVVSWAAHGLSAGAQVAFSTTGALPTGLVANTTYYVVSPGANDFQVAATYGGAAIITTGSQSGVHTSGGGVDNTWWGYWQAGAPAPSTGIPAWVSGLALRSGGPVLIDGANNGSSVEGCHVEINGVSQFDQLAFVTGSEMAACFKVTAGAVQRNRLANFRSSSAGMQIDGNLNIAGGVFATSTDNFFGPTSGLADSFLYLESTNATSALVGRVSGVEKGRITFSIGINGTIFDSNAAEYHRIGGAIVGLFDPTGLTVTGIGAFSGAITSAGLIKSSSATAGLGYATGAGGAVTQATSRTTGVTLDRVCGAITLFSAAGSTTAASFTVTNATVAAADTIIVCQKSGTDKYNVRVSAVGAGSFEITFATISGTTTEQPVFNFSVIKAVAA